MVAVLPQHVSLHGAGAGLVCVGVIIDVTGGKEFAVRARIRATVTVQTIFPCVWEVVLGLGAVGNNLFSSLINHSKLEEYFGYKDVVRWATAYAWSIIHRSSIVTVVKLFLLTFFITVSNRDQ
jgi:hypothetical protein